MRSQKAMIPILIVLILSSLPIAAHALTVTVSSGAESVSRQSLITEDVGGVLTTTVDLSGVTVAGFSISSGSAIAEQSGSEERILFQNMSIAGPAGGNLVITATSDSTDFAPKEPGGYPSAVIINASIAGTAGDAISATGDTNFDIINGYPGGAQVSLPWSCAGTSNCQFTTIGDPNADVFFDVGFETVQLDCGGAASCTPAQSFTINMTFVGTTVKLPVAGRVTSTDGSGGSLIGTVPPVYGTSLKLSQTKVDIIRLAGFPDLSRANFTLNTRFAVNGNGINPASEPVSVSVGTYLAKIPADSFKGIAKGRFAFKGNLDGVALQAQIAPLGGGNWELKVDGQGAGLTGTRNPVGVGLQIGDDSGATSGRADFLGP